MLLLKSRKGNISFVVVAHKKNVFVFIHLLYVYSFCLFFWFTLLRTNFHKCVRLLCGKTIEKFSWPHNFIHFNLKCLHRTSSVGFFHAAFHAFFRIRPNCFSRIEKHQLGTRKRKNCVAIAFANVEVKFDVNIDKRKKNKHKLGCY